MTALRAWLQARQWFTIVDDGDYLIALAPAGILWLFEGNASTATKAVGSYTIPQKK